MAENITLLIVDDSKVSRMMIINILKKSNPDWELIEAENGDEALKIATERDIDYYAIDLNMPGIGGLELIDQIKTRQPSSRVVLVTANIQDEVVRRAKDLGAACVHKPITEESVARMVEHFHD